MRIFFFNDTATTEIYTLSLHDALPISAGAVEHGVALLPQRRRPARRRAAVRERPLRLQQPRRGGLPGRGRSEEHTSELQSRQYLVCRLLLEKKNTSNTLLHLACTHILL